MRLLVIDTSTEKLQVILAESINKFNRIALARSEELFEALTSSNFEAEAIAVTIGPGSYTGIRVGLAAAQGMAHAGGLPLVGLCSLSGFISDRYDSFLSLIDARGGGVYLLPQRREGKEIIEIGTPKKCPIDELPMHLHTVKAVVGPNLARFDLLNCEERAADPAHLVRLGYAKLAQRPTEEITPLYLTHHFS